MYAAIGNNYSPRYGFHSPTHSPSKYHDNYASPPMKTGYRSTSYIQYYNNQNNQYYHDYYSSSSTASSSSQEGYYGDDTDDYDMYHQSGYSDMSTVPTIPTPLGLSKYEQNKTPSGRVLVTSSNQTIELFSCAVNAPVHYGSQ